MKLIIATLSLLTAIAVSAPASAQHWRQSLTGGECPGGTYAKDGSGWAANVKNCSAKNKNARSLPYVTSVSGKTKSK